MRERESERESERETEKFVPAATVSVARNNLIHGAVPVSSWEDMYSTLRIMCLVLYNIGARLHRRCMSRWING